jgi:hypothetical protein
MTGLAHLIPESVSDPRDGAFEAAPEFEWRAAGAHEPTHREPGGRCSEFALIIAYRPKS